MTLSLPDKPGRIEPRKNVVKIALSLAEAGLHVFPVELQMDASGDVRKVYPVKWKDGATTDPDKIRGYWKRHPHAWPGYYAGKSNVLVADGDRKHGKDYRDSLDKAGIKLPLTGLSYSTITGGEHHVYMVPPGLALQPTQNHELEDGTALRGLDTRQGISMAVYYGKKLKTSELDLAPAPDWLVKRKAYQYDDEGAIGLPMQEWLELMPKGPMTESVKAIVATVRPEGTERATVAKAQIDLANLAARGKTGVPEAFELIRAAYLKHWDFGKYPGDFFGLMKELPRKVPMPEPLVSIELEAEADHDDEDDEIQVDPITGEIIEDEPEEEDPNPIRLWRVEELLARPAPEWWIEGLFQQSSVAMFSGPSGMGKSFLMLDFAARVACGAAFYDQAVIPGRVLYVAAEGAASFGKRIQAWSHFHQLPIESENLRFVEDGVNLSDETSVAYFAERVVQYEADFIILDTFSQLAVVENENDAAQVANVLRTAQLIRQSRPGSTVIIVHHANKGGGAYRGSSVIRANVDTLLVGTYVGKEESTMWKLSTDASDDGKQKDGEPLVLKSFKLTAVPEFASAAVEKVASMPHVTEVILAVLADKEEHSMGDFLNEHRANPDPEDRDDPGDDALRERFKRALTALRGAGRVSAKGSTRNMVYRLAGIDVMDD